MCVFGKASLVLVYPNTIMDLITVMKFRVLNLKLMHEICDCNITSPKDGVYILVYVWKIRI